MCLSDLLIRVIAALDCLLVSVMFECFVLNDGKWNFPESSESDEALVCDPDSIQALQKITDSTRY